jgi:HSP20 family protein
MNTSNAIRDLLGFDPSTELNAFRDALRQVFDEGWDTPRDVPVAVLASAIVPIDVLDTGTQLVIRANMPGVKTDHLILTLKGDTLTIRGDVSPTNEEESANYLRHERRATAYTRSLTLPLSVDADRAEAHLRYGVLTLILPKSENTLPKTIKVTSGEADSASSTSSQAKAHHA